MEQAIASKYAEKVANMPRLQHGAVRVGLWLVAVAEKTGGFPVEIFYTNVISGYHKGGVDVPGIAIRPPTITKSIEALQEVGLLSIEESEHASVNGHLSKFFTLHLDD